MLSRAEIEQSDKWRIEDIYASDALWEEDYKRFLRECEMPCPYKGIICERADNLALVLDEQDKADFLAEKIYVYAFMKYYEDTTNVLYQSMSGKAQMAVTKLAEKYSFVEPEILAIDDNIIKQYLEEQIVKPYRQYIEDILAGKLHILSDKEEKLLAAVQRMADAPSKIFSKFNNADIRFGYITNEKGEEIELTHGRYSALMESNDRQVRKSAFETLYKPYSSYIHTLAETYYGDVKRAIFYANARNYTSTLEMYLTQSFIPVRVYDNLLLTVNNNLDKMHDYVALRKHELGVDELHFYDIYALMVSDYTMKVDYRQAKEMVIQALQPLGEAYVTTVREGFDNGWVDVYENTGKRNGAFSWGVYSTHPYVFLNYNDTLNDVFTVIHEMGHAMHTYYSNQTQPHIYSGYKIFVAEVASKCNETLLIHYLLKHCNDETQRKYLINRYLEQFKGTLYRQTMFAEFEKKAHSIAEQGEVLCADNLCSLYKDLNAKYFGSNMVIDKEITYEWARIPHFYTPFYVYQYATGFSAAISIATRILAGDKQTLAGYMKFLSSGGSMHPIDLLKLCGVDMEQPQVVEEALQEFGKYLHLFNQ